MNIKSYFIYLAIMAGITYLVRALPFAFVKKKVQSRFLQSFLYYIPYTVLAAMTFPAILSSTGSLASAAAGFSVALVVAYFEKGLLQVALSACAGVLLIEFISTIL